MAQLPIDYTININVSRESAGLPTPNASNIALLTTDATTIEGDYAAFITSDDALAVVNAGSTTAKMITALFSPSTTFRNNDGQLFIVPVKDTKQVNVTGYEVKIPALVSYQVKPADDAYEEEIRYVLVKGTTDAFVVEGTTLYLDEQCTEEGDTAAADSYIYTGEIYIQYDFSITAYAVTSVDDGATKYVLVAGDIEEYVAEGTVIYSDVKCTEEYEIAAAESYTYTGVKNTTYYNDTVGYVEEKGDTDSFVVAGTTVYTTANFTTIAGEASGSDYRYTGTTASGSMTVANIQTADDYIELVNSLTNTIPYWGVLIDTFDLSDVDLSGFYTYVDGANWIYVQGVEDYAKVDISNTKKIGAVYSGGDFENTKQVLAGYVSVGTSANWSGSDTALTMNLKTLGSIEAPGKIDTTVVNELVARGIDGYAITAGESKVYSYKTAGGYWDDRIGGIALTLQLQYNMYNLAANTTTKYGYTEAGVLAFKNAAARAWQQFLDNGFLVKGMEWPSESTFGDKEAFLRSIEENGYYQYSSPISSSSLEDRQSRRVTIQGAGQSAGAIHFITYNAILV